MEPNLGVKNQYLCEHRVSEMKKGGVGNGKRSLGDLNDWKWDGDIFTAHPLNSVPSYCSRNLQFFLPHPEKIANLSTNLSASGEGKRELEKRRRGVMGESEGEELNDEDGSLNLNLGSQVYPVMVKGEEKNGKKTKVIGAITSNRAVCQVQDCRADLTDAKDYHRRLKVCDVHSKATKALVGNVLKRFCQQCSRSVWESMRFYKEVLGFVPIKRPSSFKFNGAWFYNYGIGIHLIQNPDIDEFDTYVNESRPINPKDNHISFQCTDVELVKKRLEEKGMRYVTAVVDEEGIKVDQVFFHDPDAYMIELCNCDNIPIIPLSSCSFKPRSNSFKRAPSKCGFMENVMMESLSMDTMNFSF